jgi:hypothetical protein
MYIKAEGIKKIEKGNWKIEKRKINHREHRGA